MSKASSLAEAPVTANRSDARREKRYPAHIGVKIGLQVLPDGKPEEADLRDISLHGFGITVNHHIEPGTRVILRARKQRIDAEVIYCHPEEGGYRAGIAVHHAEREQPVKKRN